MPFPDPFAWFEAWRAEVPVADMEMIVATADGAGVPSARTVLLRGYDHRGFVFYTNRSSRKGRDLAANPRAALVLRWPEPNRQVTVRGPVEWVSDDESDAYFASRAPGSQIGAWASRQSQPVADRQTLEARVAEMAARFAGGPVPRPPFWGGYRVVPEIVEFWEARPNRLHDRWRWTREGTDGRWTVVRIYP
jgi:pyridoxamine 5'-phosphate oxidase